MHWPSQTLQNRKAKEKKINKKEEICKSDTLHMCMKSSNSPTNKIHVMFLTLKLTSFAAFDIT